jgi:hemerythrin-like domain-containing protein
MRPTDILLQEHRLIELAVTELEGFALTAEQGVHPAEDRSWAVIQFLREFAEGLHRSKEEHHFFPQLTRHGFGPRAGLVSVMLEEHREDAACFERVAEAIFGLNGKASCASFAKLARRYVHGMRTHMRTEKTIVFWVAAKLLTPDDEESIVDGFDRIDAASRSLLSRMRLHPVATH